jgi:hypothetical protein
MSHHDSGATICGNCEVPLGGDFCHACGQRALGPDVSLHDFFHEAFEEFAHVDGKIVQTLRILLTKPGLLTKEFLDGRRVRYISPLRVYLTCSVLFFGLAAVAPVDERPFFRVTPPTGRKGLGLASTDQLRDATVQANRAIVHDFPRVMFALMPVFGLFTWVLYRKAKPFYAAHLYYSIHFHAFVFLALTLMVSLRLAGGRYAALAWLAALVPPAIWVYHYMSLRRVFGGSRWQTAWKGTLLAIVYTVVVLAAMLVLGLRSIKTSNVPISYAQATADPRR